MKSIISVIILSIGYSAYTQKLELIDDLFTYQSVNDVDLRKDDLYIRINEWMVKTYQSSDDVIELSDKDHGIIMGNGVASITVISRLMNIEAEKKFKYTIKIDIKDYKYRFTISNIFYIDEPNQYNGYQYIETTAENVISDDYLYNKKGKPQPFNQSMKTNTELNCINLDKDLKLYISQSANDEW